MRLPVAEHDAARTPVVAEGQRVGRGSGGDEEDRDIAFEDLREAFRDGCGEWIAAIGRPAAPRRFDERGDDPLRRAAQLSLAKFMAAFCGERRLFSRAGRRSERDLTPGQRCHLATRGEICHV